MLSLTRTEAAARTALLDVTSYRVDLDLTTGTETFASRTTIKFTTAEPGVTTFLDIKPEVLYSAVLNGQPLDVGALADGRLPVPDLAARNELVVVADMPYSHECEGLHRYIDPADGRVYIYGFAYLENAPRIFACFDQPDLKAPFTFTVKAEPDWLVFGNTRGAAGPDGRWRLADTPPLPPYLTTIAAGPYESFTGEHAGVALAFRCRASLAATLEGDLDELFEVTGRCLDEFHWLFGMAYPFGAFDQIFVPEFNALSLDHPGCVLLREQYLFGPTATDGERETRAVVIAHGMSLMWMAGLVTSAWWDDLWLGQAFADYMAHRVPSQVTRFAGPPTTFAVRRKAQAFVADQRPSTHPVCLDGPDVQTILMDLDRISYFKGHAVLRQLAARIGTEALRAGLRTYFARHAYSNATFADFLAALGEAAGANMTDWADLWLRKSNVNTLSAAVTVADGRITGVVIEQTAPDTHPVLRPHTLDLGLYNSDGTSEVVRVEVDGAHTEVPQLIGRPKPALLLLNDGDLTYAKIRFDARSQAALPDLLPRLSPLNRAMVWCALLMSVQDATFPAAAYLDLVVAMVAVEPELSILTEVLEHARKEVTDRFLEPTLRSAAADRLAVAYRTRLYSLGSGDERRTVLFRALVELTADRAELRAWLAGAGLPNGYGFDADLLWRVRYRLAVLGDLTGPEIADALAADPTTRGEQYATRCRAARPDPAAKAAAWAAITADPDLSSYRLLALADGFWQPEQAELTAPYVNRFFADMPEAARLRGDMALDLLIRLLYPHHAATADTLHRAEELLARDDITVPLRRRVADATDDLRRVVAVRGGGR
jgi:aminopeptidase N